MSLVHPHLINWSRDVPMRVLEGVVGCNRSEENVDRTSRDCGSAILILLSTSNDFTRDGEGGDLAERAVEAVTGEEPTAASFGRTRRPRDPTRRRVLGAKPRQSTENSARAATARKPPLCARSAAEGACGRAVQPKAATRPYSDVDPSVTPHRNGVPRA